MTSPQDTLTYLIQNILPNDQEINISNQQENGLTILEITAPEEMKGRIIGKEGKIIKAIRTILNVSFPEQRILIKVTD